MNPLLAFVALIAALVILWFVFSSRKTQAKVEARLPKSVQGVAETVAKDTSGVRDAARNAAGARSSTSQATGNE